MKEIAKNFIKSAHAPATAFPAPQSTFSQTFPKKTIKWKLLSVQLVHRNLVFDIVHLLYSEAMFMLNSYINKVE